MAEEELEQNTDDGMEEEQTEETQEEQFISVEEYNKLLEEKEKVASFLEKANKEAKNYRLKAKEYEEAGMSPEEIKELRERQEKQKMKEMERKGEWEKLRNQLQEQYQEKEKEYQTKLQQMQQTLERNLIQKEVTSAISKHDGIPTLLQPHIERAVQLVEEENGDMVPRVVDSDGSPKFNSKGEYMSVDEYVETLKEHEEFGLAFRGRGQSGGGTKQSAPNQSGPIPRKKRSDMNTSEKRDFIGKYGIDKYNELPL